MLSGTEADQKEIGPGEEVTGGLEKGEVGMKERKGERFVSYREKRWGGIKSAKAAATYV